MALAAFTLVLASVRIERPWLRLLDAAAASAALAATGGSSSPLLPFGLLAAAEAGLAGGPGGGIVAGVVVASGSMPGLAADAGAGLAALNRVATWGALFPLAGVTAGLGSLVWGSPRSAEVERRRIARDLHDGVAQTLTHLRMELDLLSHPEIAGASDPKELARLARVADRTLADVRGLIRDLAAPRLDKGIVAAVESLADDLTTPHGPLVLVEVEGSPSASPEIEANLFRIAQEAISNAIRHSGASTITVRLHEQAGAIGLSVEDDGCGLGGPSGSPGQGIGLQAMRERAASFGAGCKIEPRMGGGTIVRISPPRRLWSIA